MTITAQQPPSNPALEFAQSILEVTNNGLELIEILRDIAEDDEKANTNDRITAANTLMDRAFGKRPRQIDPRAEPSPNTAPETANHSPKAKKEAESPRLVTQIDDSLNQSLGPAPSAGAQQPTGTGFEPARYFDDPFDPNSIHFTIQQHILDITNNGQTLRDTLLKIARACPEPVEGAEDNPRITSYHRRRAAGILVDRVLGTDPTPVLRAVQQRPEPVLSDEDYPDYPPGYVFDPTKSCIYCSQSLNMPEGHEGEHRFDHEGFAESIAEINRMSEENGLPLFDPANPPKSDRPINISRPSKKWVANNIDIVREEAAKFKEELDLRIERQKAWPAIEERRRKKLEQIYPSHSDDDDGKPPDP